MKDLFDSQTIQNDIIKPYTVIEIPKIEGSHRIGVTIKRASAEETAFIGENIKGAELVSFFSIDDAFDSVMDAFEINPKAIDENDPSFHNYIADEGTEQPTLQLFFFNNEFYATPGANLEDIVSMIETIAVRNMFKSDLQLHVEGLIAALSYNSKMQNWYWTVGAEEGYGNVEALADLMERIEDCSTLDDIADFSGESVIKWN